jgi:ATP-binding cassette subfamily B protein
MIIIMDNGRASAIGTHDELLKNNQIYQEIYYSQNNVEGGNK